MSTPTATGGGLATLAAVSAEMARELAVAQQVCIRPLARRVIDRDTGGGQSVAIPCGSTREAVCPLVCSQSPSSSDAAVHRGLARTDEPDLDQADS